MANFIIRSIPNTLTSCNLISGCIATSFGLAGDVKMALLWIIVGAVFDFFDGMSARLLHVSSPLGLQLDSLADDITFGFAPASLVYSQLYSMHFPEWMEPIADYLPYAAFVMAAFSALRLAKFNLDERQSMGFIGLPTPANALFWGALLLGADTWLTEMPYGGLLLLAMVGVSCWLLIAEIPMFALKFKHWGWKGNEVKFVFLLSAIPLLGIFRFSGLAIIIAWYVVLSILVNRRNKSL